MRVRFWGTRGSIAKPGPSTVRYGGNTSCVEVRSAGGVLVVLDCGTGAHGLGQALMAAAKEPLRGHIFISHTHWDHIQGLPFFAPLFKPGNEWDIYAPRGLGQSLRDTLAGQMQYTYFPITLEASVPRSAITIW
jgi:phosphoribosyl 1,2-cyclic phosphodiesterase